MILSRWLSRIAALAALLALVGCSRDGGGGDYGRVSGIVTHNGTPVEGAKVKFINTTDVKGEREEYATLTDSAGKYVIATSGGGGKKPGIPPGLYKVCITKLVMKGKMKIPEDFDETQLELSGMGSNVLPKEYAEFGSTKLSATVEPGKNENVNFDLKGK